MICAQCKIAGDTLQRGMVRDESIRIAHVLAAKSLHRGCEGNCDCHHSTEMVRNPELVPLPAEG